MQRKIEVGETIGTWEVMKLPYLKEGKYHADLKCQKCGKVTSFKVKYINRSYFTKRKCRSCGQKKRTDKKFKEGNVYGNLIITDSTAIHRNNNVYYKVKCICGNEFEARSGDLGRKSEKSFCNKCPKEIRISVKKKKKSTMLTNNVSKTLFEVWRRQAILRGIPFSLTPQQIDNILINQDFKCNLSGIPITLEISLSTKENRANNTASLDRIDSNKGYERGNIQFLHKTINIMKSNLDQDEFLNLCKMITNNHANFEPSSSKSESKVDEKVQRLGVEESDTNNMSKSVQQPKLYYVESNFGYGDSSRIAENLDEKEALKIFNKEINGDFTSFRKAFEYDHPIYEIREMGY